jgi:hypothetical protein
VHGVKRLGLSLCERNLPDAEDAEALALETADDLPEIALADRGV